MIKDKNLVSDNHHIICISYNSMRYSRMLEESSFANRKADYFWLLFLSSLMLLVRLPPLINHSHFIPKLF